MASYCWHAMEYLDAFGDKAGWQRLMDEMPEGARWQLDAYFPEVRKHCTWCIEAESSVRQTNGLNIEAVWEQRRCLRQSPDGRGVAYLASGGAAIAYGPCCLGNCPIGRGIPLEVR